MKARIFVFAMVLLVLGAGAWMFYAAEPDWINYDERVVGENSPLYEDVVNRPMKQIWGNFTSEHNVDGSHKPIYVLGSPYSVSSLQFRDNSGVFELSDDDGSSWAEVGGYTPPDPVVLSTTTVLDSTYCNKTILLTTGDVTLPDTTAVDANCRIEIFAYDATSTVTPVGTDRVTLPDSALGDGAAITPTSSYSALSLLPESDGWLGFANTGWAAVGGGG